MGDEIILEMNESAQFNSSFSISIPILFKGFAPEYLGTSNLSIDNMPNILSVPGKYSTKITGEATQSKIFNPSLSLVFCFKR